MLNPSLYRNLLSLKKSEKKNLHAKNWVVAWKNYHKIVYDYRKTTYLYLSVWLGRNMFYILHLLLSRMHGMRIKFSLH